MEENNMNGSGYGKKPIGKMIAIYVIIAVVLYGGYYLFFMPKSGAYSVTSNTVSPVVTQALMKFQDSPLASMAYQIFPGNLSAQAKQATSGFKISTQIQTDGSTIVSLTSSNPEYQNQQVTVQPGETLYFIEKNSGDDTPTDDTDRTTADDSTVLVDPQGNIVQ